MLTFISLIKMKCYQASFKLRLVILLFENLVTFKVQNFDPLAIYIYNYLRFKQSLRVKVNKDILPKAFDNLYMLLMKFIEKLNTPFSDEVLWAFFNELFDIYVKIKESSTELEEINEKIDNMKLEIDEVTSK